MSARYSPGSAYAFVGGHTTVVVSTADSTARDAIWPLVSAGAPIQQLAAALLTHAGTVADFVCLRRDADALTALIRGSFRVRLGDGSELDGAKAATWREWSVPLSWPVEILTDAVSPEETLPLAAGVVRAGQVTLLDTGERTASTEPQMQEDPSPPARPLPPAPPVAPAPPAAPSPEEPVIPEPEPVDAVVSAPPEPVKPPPEKPAGAPAARHKYDHHYEDSITPDALETAVAASSSTPVISGPPSVPSDQPSAQPPHLQQASQTGFIQAIPDFSPVRAHPPAADPAPPAPVAAAAVHRVRLPTGETVQLDRPTIFGREPAPPPGREQSTPDLIALANPEKDISGSHLELRPDGEHILAIDLSRYGTYLQMPGTEAVRLPAGKPFPLAPGARLHLNGTLAIDYVGMS